MSNSWKFFWIIEVLFLIATLWQISTDEGLLVATILGIVLLYFAQRKSPKTAFRNFLFVFGFILLAVSLLSTVYMWVALVFAVLFFGLRGVELSGLSFFQAERNSKKKIKMIQTEEPVKNGGRRFKRSWFGNERIGQNRYEWDDINFSIVSGDTLVDLGATLLPKKDNVVIIRKGLGRTRILVPLGVGIVFEHSALYGELTFADEHYRVRNESFKLYSEDYDTQERRLKIVTNVLFGDVEVIRI